MNVDHWEICGRVRPEKGFLGVVKAAEGAEEGDGYGGKVHYIVRNCRG